MNKLYVIIFWECICVCIYASIETCVISSSFQDRMFPCRENWKKQMFTKESESLIFQNTVQILLFLFFKFQNKNHICLLCKTWYVYIVIHLGMAS